MNIRLLEKVRDYIVEHPEKYEQGEWCGTRCCIAGHAAVLSRNVTRKEVESWSVFGMYARGQKALRLDFAQADSLFLYWPDKFDRALQSAKTAKGRARVAYRYINHFIETRGAQ